MLPLLLALCAGLLVRTAGDVSNHPGELVYLQILGSNGFHAPLQLYPGDPNQEEDWPDGMGQLTKLGMKQQFEMGKILRRHYSSIITSDPREVEVFSSCEDRSIQSSLCLLSSLYAPSRPWRFAPNFNWQPIPVTWADSQFDKYVGYNAVCPKLISERNKIFKSTLAQLKMQQDEYLYSYLSNCTGSELSHWNDIADLYDTLEKEEAMGLEIPDWAREFWDDMMKIANSAYIWNVRSKFSLRAKIGALLDLMVDRTRAKTLDDDPNPQVKVNIYMTHDWNIAAFLVSLSRYEGIRPPPAAAITMELWKRFGAYNVRFLYFNSTTEARTLRVRGCSDFCPLAYVTNYFQDFITKDWPKTCGLRHKNKEQSGEDSGRPFSLSN